MRNQIDYNETIGYDSDGNAVVLNYTFDDRIWDDKPFKGAKGAIIELVSQERYDDAMSTDAQEEYWEEVWRQEAGMTNGTTLGLTEWIANLGQGDNDGVFDSGYSECVPAGDHVATNCIGCGRIFPDALDDLVIVLRPDLVEIIRAIEGE